MSDLPKMNQCPKCHDWYAAAHFCRLLNPNPSIWPGAAPVQPLTEADVRRIVREELDRAAAALAGDTGAES